MPKRRLAVSITLLVLLILASIWIYLNPSLQERVSWHLNQWLGRLRTWLHPPQAVSFSPVLGGNDDASTLPDELVAAAPSGEMESSGDVDAASGFEQLPKAYSIAGGNYFSQSGHMNYCGPSALAMLLSYWEWDGTHDDVARGVRTYNKDKNIMPYELEDFTENEAGLGMIVRVGGSLEILKRLITAGFPVIVEKGPLFRDIQYNITWMGHYQVLSGYNDQEGFFIAQDPYIEPNYQQPYESLLEEWRSFNYLYLVAFPPHLENDVLNLLGDDADEEQNYRNALKIAQDEIYQLDGVDQFFAMFNYGSNLVKLRDYNGAAKTYDQAFILYDSLPKDTTVPYRILWYQTGPFLAYYYTGRYHDVIEKATKNSIEMVRDNEPALEESFYWRGKAKIAIGDKEGGIKDFRTCLELHRDFQPCVDELNDQGIFLD